jgi:hypothetical protein
VSWPEYELTDSVNITLLAYYIYKELKSIITRKLTGGNGAQRDAVRCSALSAVLSELSTYVVFD